MRRLLWGRNVCLFAAVMLVSCGLLAEPVMLSDAQKSWPVLKWAETLADPTCAFSIESVTQSPLKDQFRPVGGPTVNLGLMQGANWYRFSVVNPGTKERVLFLDIGNPRINLAELFIPLGDGRFEHRTSGTYRPFAARDFAYRSPSFRLVLVPGQEQTIHLRITNKGSFRLCLMLRGEAHFQRIAANENSALGLFYGALLIMALHSGMIFIALRDRSFLYHSLFILSLMFYEMVMLGSAFQFLWPNATWWADRSVLFFFGVAMSFGVLITRAFLNTRIEVPNTDKALIPLSAGGVIIALGSLSGLLWVDYLAHMVGGIAPLVVAGAAIRCLMMGNPAARFLLAAWGAMLVGALVMAFVGTGILPSTFFTENAVHFGAGVTPILLSLALADRLRVLETRYRSELEARVEERTRELQDALDNVRTLKGLIPLCSRCKKVRDDKGYWNSIETYIAEHSDADLSHGLCPQCAGELYGEKYGRIAREQS